MEEDEKLERKSSRWSPISLSKSTKCCLVLSRSHTRTHTVPLSCRSRLYLSWPASFHCLRQARSHALSLSLDDVIWSISPALPSCSQTVLAKTHLPETPCSKTHTHIYTLQNTFKDIRQINKLCSSSVQYLLEKLAAVFETIQTEQYSQCIH